MRCEEITNATESILKEYRRLNVPLDEYLLIRERAIHELLHGVEFSGHQVSDAPTTMFETTDKEKTVVNTTKVSTETEPPKKTVSNKPKPKPVLNPAPKTTTKPQPIESDNHVNEIDEPKEMSDFEILKNLKDEWN